MFEAYLSTFTSVSLCHCLMRPYIRVVSTFCAVYRMGRVCVCKRATFLFSTSILVVALLDG